MKKLLIIILFAIPLLTKSQQIPEYDSLGNLIYYVEDTIKIPSSVAKQIAKDLVICDSTKAVLELTKEQLSLTEQKVSLKDSIINDHVNKGIMYEERINNEQDKFKIQGRWVEDLRKQNKELKTKLVYTKITMSLAILFLGYIIIK